MTEEPKPKPHGWEKLIGFGVRSGGLVHLIADAHQGGTPFSGWIKLACADKHHIVFEDDVPEIGDAVTCLACLAIGGARW